MSVHYKFKSALSFDTITFDGLHISIRDLKKSILQQKQIGKASDFDLQITNAQSNEVYEDDNTLVPKNSSLIVVRIPLTSQQKKAWEKSDSLPALGNKLGDFQDPHASKLAKTVDLANVEASEADKIQAAITQSTLDYDPSNYLRIKGSNQVGELPTNYRCYKCNQPGHWIKDCKFSVPQETNVDIKKSTGIPQSFMVPVEGPLVPGAMMTPTGHYAVPSIEHEARREPVRKVQEPMAVEKPVIPEDLICGVCKDLLADAVLIPCCGNSFCDECIRNVLLESEDHQCPDCKEKDVSPDTLIPNRFLRTSVNNFRNQTGYCRTAPSFAQSKMAAQPSDAPPHPVDATVNVDTPPAPSASPLTQPPKDNGPPPRRERMSPDDVEIVDESAPVPGTIPAIGSDDAVASPIDSISSIQPIRHIVAGPMEQSYNPMEPSYKHYSHNDDYHKRGPPFKPHFRLRHDRSDTPTVDERSSEPILYPIESLAPQPPRMMMNQRPPPPHMFPTGNFVYRPNYPPPPRHDMPPYPPGVDHMPPRISMNYRGNSYFVPRAPRPPYRPPHPSNGPHHAPNVGPVDDPLEVFERLLKEKDLGRGRDRPRFRRRSRSFSRSYSRSPSPRVRSRPPRSRSRSSTRVRSRTRSPPPRSPRSPPPRSRSRSNIRRRSRSRSFSISSRSRSPPPRSPRSFHSRSPSRDRARHYSPLPPVRKKVPPPHRLDSPPPRHHSPIRYYSRGYKDEFGPPPKGDRDRPVERLDRDRDRDVRPRSRERDRGDRGDRGRRFKPSSVVQEYYPSNQDFNRHPNDRYDSKDGRYGDRPRDRDRDFDKDRDRERERVVYKRDRIPGIMDEPVPPPPHKYDNYEVRDRIRSDWEKTRDRELELQERERERQAAAGNSAPGTSDYYHGDKGGSSKKREPSRVRPVEPITGVPRGPLPPEHPDDRECELNYVPTAQDSPHTETQSTNTKSPKSPEKEKKSKEKKKKKSKEEFEKKKKKKKIKEKSDKKESSEQGDVASTSTPGGNENDEESKPPPEIPPVAEDPLYGDLAEKSLIVDIGVVESYPKPPAEVKDPPKDKDVVLAPVPELSKWEKEDEPLSQSEERVQENGSETKQVTSEVLKRAENAIFKKSINLIASEKKPERKVEGKKSSKERDKVEPTKEVVEKPKEEKVAAPEATDKPKDKEPSKPAVVVEREISPKKMEKREDRRDDRDRRERDERDRRERDERDRHREREKERDRERERERREQEREREERYRLKMIEKEKERQLQMSKEIVDRERFSISEKSRGSSERKIETIPLRISAKERLGAKVEDRTDVKKRLERRDVKTEKPPKKPKRDSESNDVFDKKKEEDRIVTTTDDKKEVIVISQATAESQALQAKKRSVSLDTDRLVKKIKLTQDEGSTVDSGSSSEESVSVKKHKKKKKKKHRKKKKKRRHSSSDSDSSSSSSDSETEKKKKKKSKKSKKRKKSKK